MDNTLSIVHQTELLGKPFQIYGTTEHPLFLAKDVAEWIEHSQVCRMLQNVDDYEKVVNNVHTLGGNQDCWFLTEYGLYEVLMQSRKPIAKVRTGKNGKGFLASPKENCCSGCANNRKTSFCMGKY